MKAKALRRKDTKEFVHIIFFDETAFVFTGELPELRPEGATIELMKVYYRYNPEIDFRELELVELEIIINN